MASWRRRSIDCSLRLVLVGAHSAARCAARYVSAHCRRYAVWFLRGVRCRLTLRGGLQAILGPASQTGRLYKFPLAYRTACGGQRSWWQMEPRSLAAVAEAARIPTTGSPRLVPPCRRGLRLVRRRHHQRHVCPGVCVRRLRLFSGYGPHRHTSPRASTRDRCCALAILSMLPLCLRCGYTQVASATSVLHATRFFSPLSAEPLDIQLVQPGRVSGLLQVRPLRARNKGWFLRLLLHVFSRSNPLADSGILVSTTGVVIATANGSACFRFCRYAPLFTHN